jgi:hypothetical protein
MKGLVFYQRPKPTYSYEEVNNVLETSLDDRRTKKILRLWENTPVKDIVTKLNISPATVFRLVKGRVGKKRHVIKHRAHQDTFIVLNLETGIYYTSISMASKTVGIHKCSFRDYLVGRTKHPLSKTFKIV